MSTESQPASTMTPEEVMEAYFRTRTDSQSTSGGVEPSIFSAPGSVTTADTSPSRYSEEDGDIVEIDKKTFEASTAPELEEISKETFEPNVTKAENPTTGGVKVINGSTLGDIDPIHVMVRGTSSEPRWWIDERRREDRQYKKRKRSEPSTLMYKPDYFDDLPYSPQDFLTSGLDQECAPEENSEEFWDKVSKAFHLSCRYETVEQRRDQFGFDVFESRAGTPSPSRFNDEL